MKSATLTRHLCCSNAPVCMFHTDYIIWKYLFSIWICSFESRHCALYRYVFLSVRQIYIEFRAQVYRDRDSRKLILFAFIILQKRNVLLLLWVHTNKCRVFTDSKDVLLLSVWPKMTSICPAVSAFLHTPHRNLNSAHFSRITLDWAVIEH